MSFIDTALAKGKDTSKIILTATTETSILTKDGKRQIIKRLLKGFVRLNSYKEAFKREFEIGSRLRHPNILSYEEYEKEENGDPYIRMASLHCVSFDFYLKENPAFIAQTKDINRIISEIMDAVSYMHREGILHLDLKPSNLLITRNRKNILLVNPAFTYLSCKPSITLGNGEFSAPEMSEDGKTPDERSDIYSIGKIIEYIFTFSDVPFEYRKIIKKATQANPAKRYQSVEEMKTAVKRSSVWVNAGKRAIYMTAFLAFFFLIWFGLIQDSEETEFITPAQNPNMELPEENMLNSEGFVVPDTSLSSVIELTPEQAELQKIYQEQAEKIFKKEFAKKADAELSKVYTTGNMNSDLDRFKNVSMKSMSNLDEYQKELCKKYEMDPIIGAKLAAEVISAITREKMQELENKKKEE